MSHITSTQAKRLLGRMGVEKAIADLMVSEMLAEIGNEDISNDYFLFKCVVMLGEQNKELLERVKTLENQIHNYHR